MKAKFGAIVTDGRGKLGGSVFSKNRYGLYEKTKVTPLNTPSAYKSIIKNNHKTVVSAWSNLTDAERQSWNSGTYNFPQKNTFSDTCYLSGYALFLKLNLNRLLLSQSLLHNCPTVKGISNIISASFEARYIDNTLILTYSPLCPAGFIYKVHATPPVSAGISYSNRRFKLIGLIQSTDISPLDLSAWYLTRYPEISPVGSKIFLKITPIEIATGIESQPFIIHSLILNSLDMLKSSTTFSASDMVAGTVKELIPAPGPNKIIVIVAAVQKIIIQSTPYRGSGMSLVTRYAGATGLGACVTNATIIRTTDTTTYDLSVVPSSSDMANVALTCTVFGTPTAGDSLIKLDYYYMINDK
jgi:hypothetical protein